MTQRFDEDLPLFAQAGLARRTDPDTSGHGAHDARVSGRLARQAAAVLAAIRRWPGRTTWELSELAGLDRYACSRRAPYLAECGLVRRGDEKRTCEISRRLSTVWMPITIATGMDNGQG